MTIFGANGEPIGPTPAQQRAAAIQAQLAMGTMALRVLAVLLSEMPGRKTTIRKVRVEKLREKYPGSVIRFGEDTDALKLALMTPDELDAADKEIARLAAERRETLEGMATPDAED